MAQLPRTQFTHRNAPNPHARKTSTQNFRISYWHSYPERNLHTATRQTRMPGRHQHKIFASPIGTATPNAIYTQQRAKPACQEDVNSKFSHLLLAQLPRTQFTHSSAPNPHARKTSTQNFRISYWHSYPERNLHTAMRHTRMPGRHQRKIFASPLGAAAPNTIYTQQRAKPACQQDINTKFYLLLAQLPRMQFTRSNAPTRMPGIHQRKIFASPFGAATPNAMYTQQRAKPEWQEDINAKFSHLPLAQLPRKQFTHCNAPNPHARKTSTRNFRISYWRSYPERNLHTGTRQTRMPGRRQRKIFASPIGTATPNAIYTQQRAKPACQEDINTKFSHLHLAQLPRTQFTHSNAPNPNARKTSTQNFRISHWRYPRTRFRHSNALNLAIPVRYPKIATFPQFLTLEARIAAEVARAFKIRAENRNFLSVFDT